MSEEWSDWIEHDGTGCPVPEGTVAEIAYDSGSRSVVVVEDGPWWHGGGWRRWRGERARWAPIIRYRVKKPRGLAILEGILASVTEREDA